ncbi:MAG: type VI secretion system baseplate subunit TssG [Cellvibrionaceae bacterium]
MATENRQARADLISSSQSSKSGSLNDFFEIVRRIERQSAIENKHLDGFGKDTESFLGTDNLPDKEVLRFKGNYSLAFAGSPVESLKLLLEDENFNADKKNEVFVNFMGIAGPSGVLPQHYSRLILDRIKQKDHALIDFIDIFNHRLVSLFYRSWIKYRFALQREFFDLQQKKDPFTNVLESISGKNGSTEHDAQLYYAGHFSRKSRSLTNLENMLADYLSVPVSISSFVGNWLTLEKRDRSCLRSRVTLNSQKLGEGIMLGSRSWDVASKIAIHIGSIDFKTYEKFLPGSDVYKSMKRLIESYVPVHIKIDLFFKVHDVRSNAAKLGSGVKLKQNVWLQSTESSSNLVSKLSFSRSI